MVVIKGTIKKEYRIIYKGKEIYLENNKFYIYIGTEVTGTEIWGKNNTLEEAQREIDMMLFGADDKKN